MTGRRRNILSSEHWQPEIRSYVRELGRGYQFIILRQEGLKKSEIKNGAEDHI